MVKSIKSHWVYELSVSFHLLPTLLCMLLSLVLCWPLPVLQAAKIAVPLPWKISPSTVFLKVLEQEDDTLQTVNVEIKSPGGERWRPLETDAGFLTGLATRWQAEDHAADGLSPVWSLRLEWSGKKMTAGRPRGSLIKESLLVRTSLPGTAEYFTVPTMGLVRAIPRETPTALKAGAAFRYGEQPRWQGWWEQPNHAAAVLATGALLIPAWLGRRRKQKTLRGGEGETRRGGDREIGRPEDASREGSVSYPLISLSPPLKVSKSSVFSQAIRLSCKLAAAAAFLWLIWHLALTYSRGGWVAFVAGAGVFALRPGGWRLFLAVAGAFAVALLQLPQGMERAGGMARVAGDGSIGHRLEFWRAALAMLTRQPWSGVGEGNFNDEFQRWFARPEFSERVANAISDPMTLAAEHGLPGLAAWLTPLVFVLVPAFRRLVRLRQNRSFIPRSFPFILSLTAACVCFLTAGLFSKFWDQKLVWPLPLACLVLLGLLLAANAWRERQSAGRWLRGLGRWLAGGAALMTLLLAVAYGAGRWLDAGSAKPSPAMVSTGEGPRACLRIHPPQTAGRGLLLYMLPPGESAAEWIKPLLRPLAATGWEVWAPDSNSLTEADLEALWRNMNRQFQARHPGLPTAMAGHGAGGLSALRLAAGFSAQKEGPRLVATAQLPLGLWTEIGGAFPAPRCELRAAYATGESGPPRWASLVLHRELSASLDARAIPLPGPWVKGAVCPATQAWVKCLALP